MLQLQVGAYLFSNSVSVKRGIATLSTSSHSSRAYNFFDSKNIPSLYSSLLSLVITRCIGDLFSSLSSNIIQVFFRFFIIVFIIGSKSIIVYFCFNIHFLLVCVGGEKIFPLQAHLSAPNRRAIYVQKPSYFEISKSCHISA